MKLRFERESPVDRDSKKDDFQVARYVMIAAAAAFLAFTCGFFTDDRIQAQAAPRIDPAPSPSSSNGPKGPLLHINGPKGPSLHPSPSPTPIPTPQETLTPDEILGRTEATLRQNPDPPYIYYKMHEIFVHHGTRHEYDYQVWYRADGKGLMQNMAPGRRGKNETFFGYPFPSAPDNNILLYATPAPRVTAPPPVGTPAPGTKNAPVLTEETITGNRYYIVSFAGLESFENHAVYHLTLRPVSDETKHPWKDLWVDTQTFQVWKAHADASGNVGPLSGRAVADVEFAPIGNYWMVKQATADGEGHFGFISDSGHYEYYFSDFRFPNTLPDWYFDEAEFNKHRP